MDDERSLLKGKSEGPSLLLSSKMAVRNLTVTFRDKPALKGVDLDLPDKSVTAIIGPSGCGKTTFLRSLNRMNDLIERAKTEGQVYLDGEIVTEKSIPSSLLRARVGMVFQEPNPFPKTIFENVAFGPRIHGLATSREELEFIVQTSLESVGLWSEVKDELGQLGTSLSGGQQQRLVIARAIAINPEVILMDEPCSALDPVATAKIEELIDELRHNYCIVIVTHSMSQAARVSRKTAFLEQGEFVEIGSTEQIFTNPRERRTHDYITKRYG